MSSDFIGCLNGLNKVGAALLIEIASVTNKEFSLVNSMSSKPVLARVFYGEVRLPNLDHNSSHSSPLYRSLNVSKLNSASGRPLQAGRRGWSQYHTCATPTEVSWQGNGHLPLLKHLKRTTCTDNSNNGTSVKSKEGVATRRRKVYDLWK